VTAGGDSCVGDTPQRTAIAAADGAVHDEPVFSRDEEDQCITSPQR
jgi:hypothetical protein